MAKTPHRKSLWAVIIGLFLALAALAAVFLTRGAGFPRLEVAGFRIDREEYRQVMYRARDDVLSDHAAAGHSLKDWTAETPLGDPIQMTMDRAIEILTETYAVSTLAVERGYLADAGYDALVRELEDINRKRQEALENGDMVTGIPSFTMADFLDYRASSLRLQFCNDPENPENQVTEEDIRARYEADRDDLYRQPDSMELRFLLADAAPGEADGLHQELEALAQKARESGDLAAALAEFPQLQAHYQEISVTAGTYSIYARSHGDVLIWAADLQTGDISPVIRQENRLCLIQCLDRTVHQYVPLEDVQSVVIQSIRESRYDALIAQRMAITEVRGNLDALYRFTAEQLG